MRKIDHHAAAIRHCAARETRSSSACNQGHAVLSGPAYNSHHIIESVFKATARALRQAVEPDPRATGVPSTKGVL